MLSTHSLCDWATSMIFLSQHQQEDLATGTATQRAQHIRRA